MKKLRIISICVLAAAILCMALWRFAVPVSDWVVRITGVLILVSVFLTTFSTVKTVMTRK
jgi:hypothetical protein